MRALMEEGFWSGIALGAMFMGLLMGGFVACADGRPSLTTAIRVWHDDQRGVTCWIAEGKNNEAAITCLPDSALKVAP